MVEMNLSGKILFNDDRAGSLSGDISKLSCTWEDSLIFDFKDFCRGGDMYTGSTIYYAITAIKN